MALSSAPPTVSAPPSVYFLYANEDIAAAELCIGAALKESPALSRAGSPQFAAATLVFVSEAFIASPECLRSARIINDVFAGRARGCEVSRVIILFLVPSFLQRSQAWSEIAFLFATAVRIDLPYGLETLTQARLDVIVAALNSAVKAEVAHERCLTRERVNFSYLFIAILLSIIAVSSVMTASLVNSAGTMMYEATSTAIYNSYLMVDKNLGDNGNNSLFFSCTVRQTVAITRLLGGNQSQQLVQTICADLKRVITSRCMYFSETKCSGSWQPWQLGAVSDTYQFSENVTRDLNAVFPTSESMLIGNYFLMCLSTLPMYILVHPCWFGSFSGRFIPCCLWCVRFAARRPLSIWAVPFVLLLLSQILAVIAYIQTQDFSESLSDWESQQPLAQMGPFIYASSNWDARYTDPVTGGLIYLQINSRLVSSIQAVLYGTSVTLGVWLFTLFAGGVTFFSRRGTNLTRSQVSLTSSQLDIHHIQMTNLVHASTVVHRPVPIVSEYSIESPRLRVFLSHSWSSKFYLNDVVQRLSKCGISYWLDVRDMNPGDEMFFMLSQGVGSVDVVLAFLTFEYLMSGNCNKEFKLAMKTNTPVVVIALQGRIWKENHSWLRSSTVSVHPLSNFIERRCIVLDFTICDLTKIRPVNVPLLQRISSLPQLPDTILDRQFELLVAAINFANAMQVPREIGGKHQIEAATYSVAMLYAPEVPDRAVRDVLKSVLVNQGCHIADLDTADVIFAILTHSFLKNERLIDDFVQRSTCAAQRIVMVLAEEKLPFFSHPKLGPYTAGQAYIPVEVDLKDLSDGIDKLITKLKPYSYKDSKNKFTPNPFEIVHAAWRINRTIVVSGPRTEQSACNCIWALLFCSHLCMTRQRSFYICASLATFLSGLLFLILACLLGSGAELIAVNTTDQGACPPSVVVVPSSLTSSALSATTWSLVLALCACVFATPLLQSLWLQRGFCGRFGAVCARASLACSTTFFWATTAAFLFGIIICGAKVHFEVDSLISSLNIISSSHQFVNGTYKSYGNCVYGRSSVLILVFGSWALGSWFLAGFEARTRFMCGGRFRLK